MNVVDIMTPEPRAVPSSSSVGEGLALMAELHIRHLPVVDAGEVVGVVSDRDLLEATGEPPGAESPLRTVMHSPATTVQPDDTLVMASVEMAARKIGSLPVVDDARTLVGMLTETDVLRAFARASRGGRLEGDHDPLVANYMSRDPITVTPETILGVAISKARDRDFRHLPVVDGGDRLVGLVSDRDLCREIGRGSDFDLPISEAMTATVVTLAPEDRLTRAADLMVEKKISGLPVLQGAKLVGILSSTDILDHCLNMLGQG